MSGVTVREWKPAAQGEYVQRHYSDDEIEELFQHDDGSLVMALLRRAQRVEKLVEAMRRTIRNAGLMEPIA